MRKWISLLLGLILMVLTTLALGEVRGVAAMNEEVGRQEYIWSMCNWQGQLYGLSGRGVIYRLDGEEWKPFTVRYDMGSFADAVEKERQKKDENISYAFDGVNHLISDGERMFGLNQNYSWLFYELCEDAEGYVFQARLRLNTPALVEAEIDGAEIEYTGSAFVNGSLYVGETAISSFTGEPTAYIYVLDADEGKYEEIELKKEMRRLTGYRDNQLLCLINGEEHDGVRYDNLEALDPLTGEMTTLMEIQADLNTGFIMYDPTTDAIYRTLNNEIIRLSPEGGAEVVGRVMGALYMNSAALMPNGVLAVFADTLSTFDLTEPPEKAAPLMILGAWKDETQTQMSFTAADIQPTYEQAEDAEVAGRFAQDMINGSPDVDIYMLPVNDAYLDAMAGGYYEPLNGAKGISERMSTVYEPLKPYLINASGDIWAYPIWVRQTGLGYSQWALDEIGAELPQGGYADFVTGLTSMISACDSRGLQLVDDNSITLQSTLFDDAVTQYMLLYDTDPKLAQSRKADMAEIMDAVKALESIKELSYVLPAGIVNNTKKIAASQPDAVFTLKYSLAPNMADFGMRGLCTYLYQPLIVPLFEGAPARIPAEMRVMVVNPYSQRKDTAMAYLTYYDQLMSDAQRAVLFEGVTQVEAKIGTDRLRMLSREEDALKALPPTEDKAELRDRELRMADIAKRRAALEKTRWEVTPESVKNYRETLPAFAFGAELSNESHLALGSYLAGRTSAEQCLDRLMALREMRNEELSIISK